MKAMKKIATFFVCLCMFVGMMPMVAHAASGELRFSDPSTTVGAYVEVTAKLTADYSIDTADVTLTYDTEYLRFKSGDDATEENGVITIAGEADGSTEVSWTLKFQALQEGDTKIEISSVSAVDTDGDSISVTEGSSAVSIGPGDPSLIEDDTVAAGEAVEVNGTTYTIATEISELLIPTGFVATEVVYNGTTYPAVMQQSSGMTAMYLLLEEEGDFFVYDSETGTFGDFCQILISADRFIILLPEGDGTTLPEYLQQTTMTIDEKPFVAWQNVKDVEYYVIYALNSDGVKGYYQYDTVDGTYQRYVPEVVVVEEEPTEPVDIFLALVEENLLTCILGAALVIFLLIFILIIVAIKLRHRNLELDDLYDEYGIDEEGEEEKEEPKKKKGLFGKKEKDEEYDEDDEDDYEEDDFEEESFDSFQYDASEDEEKIDDLDELLNTRTAKPVTKTQKPAVKPAARKAPEKKAKPAARPAEAPVEKAAKPRQAAKPAQPRKSSKPAVKPAAPRPTMTTVGKPEPQRIGHSDLDDTFKMDIVDLD